MKCGLCTLWMWSFKCNCWEQYTLWAGAVQQQKPFKNHAKRFKRQRDMHRFLSNIYYALKSLHTKTKCSCDQSIMIAAHVFFHSTDSILSPLPAESIKSCKCWAKCFSPKYEQKKKNYSNFENKIRAFWSNLRCCKSIAVGPNENDRHIGFEQNFRSNIDTAWPRTFCSK